MQVTITAGGIQALCAVLIVLGGFCAWAVKLIVSSELRKLNGRYVYADGSKVTGHEIEWRLKLLEEFRGHGKGAKA